MNAVVMDDAKIGANCIVGALSLVKAGEIIPDQHLFAGNPGKVIRALADDQVLWKTEGTALYQQLPAECHASLLPVEPLTEMEAYRPNHTEHYQPWKKA
jgi:carbonic anhydrase/acetyltransferase-like protein (isoleucine patch superfamily)